MSPRRRVPIVLAVLALALSPVAPVGAAEESRQVVVPGGSYTAITVAPFARMLETKDFVLVNVHVPYEGELERTDAFVPYDRIEANVDKLPADRNAKIVLYCMSGRMSAIAARTLVKLGYRSVWDVEGGMVAWEKAGRKIVTRRH